jgi:D-alanine-D-alanine ligase
MASKIKVAILYGGRSVEHGVSINSARNIFENIDRKKYDPIAIGITTKGQWFITKEVDKAIHKGEPLAIFLNASNPYLLLPKSGKKIKVDIIFPVLHGTDGEDGSIQGLIKALDIPMVGTSVLGSSLSMNKIVSKRALHNAGLPVTKFVTYTYEQKDKIRFNTIAKELGVPFMVKAANLGSSVGVSKVNNQKDFKRAVEEAFKYDHEMLAESYVTGREIECAILGNYPPEASLPGEVIISKDYEFYTFDAKYVDPNAVKIDIPANLPKGIVEKIRKDSVKAFEALHCKDFARVDLFLDAQGEIYINEINTIPGFTNSSMFPVMWKERGISFKKLITTLLTLALERYERTNRIQRDFDSSLKF